MSTQASNINPSNWDTKGKAIGFLVAFSLGFVLYLIAYLLFAWSKYWVENDPRVGPGLHPGGIPGMIGIWVSVFGGLFWAGSFVILGRLGGVALVVLTGVCIHFGTAISKFFEGGAFEGNGFLFIPFVIAFFLGPALIVNPKMIQGKDKMIDGNVAVKTPHTNLRLIFGGDTVLPVFSVVFLLASLSGILPELRVFGVYGFFTPILSATFLILCCWQLIRYQRLIRTFISAIFFLAATIISSYTIFHGTGPIH